ncbi:MAG: SGNH/GDSL hydrolase family protein [Ktedonobacterales bacterium]|nr:SGNH/GDSL hydrolase family protein [Ktedonobacterales bacterium]
MLRALPRPIASTLLVALLHLGLAAFPHAAAPALNGNQTASPNQYYLALGDSLAFGYQPDIDFVHGYADDVLADLRGRGTTTLADLGCPGESSATFIAGGCPYPLLRKFPYIGAQLGAAVAFLKRHPGQARAVTLDIGANDLLPDVGPQSCAVGPRFLADLRALDAHLVQTILPQLRAALAYHGRPAGDLLLLNYYDPFQNRCPASVPFVRLVNQHLARDVRGFGRVVDVFAALGGGASPNPMSIRRRGGIAPSPAR